MGAEFQDSQSCLLHRETLSVLGGGGGREKHIKILINLAIRRTIKIVVFSTDRIFRDFRPFVICTFQNPGTEVLDSLSKIRTWKSRASTPERWSQNVSRC